MKRCLLSTYATVMQRVAQCALFAALMVMATATQSFAQRGASILPGASSRSPISINAEKLDYFDKEQKLIYSGAVIAKQGDSTLKSSVLTIFLSGSGAQPGEQAGGGPSNSQVKRMEAAGPVTIISKDQVGTGDRGIYDKADNKIYLIGNVVLSQGANVMKGKKDAKLTYDLTTGHAQILGGVDGLFTPGSDDPTKKKADTKTPSKPKR